MTKERLEELIKQRAKVWDEFWHEEVQLSASNCYIKPAFNVGKYNLFVEEDEEHCPSYYLDNLREDWERAKAEYEWKENVHAERTERFEPPMWDDLIKEIGGHPGKWTFTFANGSDIYCFRVWTSIQSENAVCIEITKRISWTYDVETLYWNSEAYKSDYIMVCGTVRDLFGGKK